MSSSSLEDKEKLKDFWIEGSYLYLRTMKGKLIKRHKSISPKLALATQTELQHFEILGDGIGIHWPKLDEDLSAAFLIYPEKFNLTFKKVSSK